MWRSRKRLSWQCCVLGRSNITSETTVGSKRDFKRLLPGLIVSAVTLTVALYFVDLRELAEALRLADYRYIALGLGIAVLWVVVRALFWRTLLQDKPTFRDVFYTECEGYLLNNILPFRLGEVARVLLLNRKTGLSFVQVLSTIVVERGFDVAIAAGILLTALPFVVGADWARPVGLATGGLVLAAMVFLYLLARNHDRAVSLFDRVSAKIPVLQRFGGKFIESFFQGISVFNSPGLFLKAVALVSLNWAIAFLQYFIFMKAFFPHAQPLWAYFSLGALALGVAAPSSPGAVGVYELTLVGALSLFDPNSSAAFAFALTSHLLAYIMYGILGAFALARDGETLSGLYQSARELAGNRKRVAS